jgi:hypothetical protein
MTLKAEKFEEVLSAELTRELEPQRGKALAAFRAELAAERAAEARAVAGSIARVTGDGKGTWLRGNKQISRKEMWFWASVPSLLAACVAVVVTLQLAGPRGGGIGTSARAAGKSGGTIVVNAPQVEQTVVTRQARGDVILANDKAMQLTQEQTIRETKWKDPVEKASYRVIEQPVEKVGYQEITPF